MDLAELPRQFRWVNEADHQWHQPLVAPRHLVEFPVHPVRLDRGLADEPDHRVGEADELGELRLPLLAERQIARVDGDVEAARGERRDNRIRGVGVLPRVGDEDL